VVEVEGFKAVEVAFDRREATVSSDPGKTTPEKLAEAVRKGTGLTVTIKKKEAAG
jgi:copper chaperone CopZ